MAGRARELGLRPYVDESSETVGKKIRAAQLMKAPYTLVIGDREVDSGDVSVRDRQGNETRGVAFETFLERIREEADSKALEQTRFAD
jgi:threonyl-tRNA synthetase